MTNQQAYTLGDLVRLPDSLEVIQYLLANDYSIGEIEQAIERGLEERRMMEFHVRDDPKEIFLRKWWRFEGELATGKPRDEAYQGAVESEEEIREELGEISDKEMERIEHLRELLDQGIEVYMDDLANANRRNY